MADQHHTDGRGWVTSPDDRPARDPQYIEQLPDRLKPARYYTHFGTVFAFGTGAYPDGNVPEGEE